MKQKRLAALIRIFVSARLHHHLSAYSHSNLFSSDSPQKAFYCPTKPKALTRGEKKVLNAVHAACSKLISGWGDKVLCYLAIVSFPDCCYISAWE